MFGGPPTPAHSEHGRLVDDTGLSLYTFDQDASGQSRCTDECAIRFPPLRPAAPSKRIKEYRVLKRPDGTLQWSFKGKPLYHYSGDHKPGDMGGDGDSNLWRLARP